MSNTNYDYKNPNLPVTQRVEDLLSRMTLEEKVAQLQCLIFQEQLKENMIGYEGIGGLALTRLHMPYTVKEETEMINKLQRYIVEKTRLGIPAIFHGESLHGLVAKGATSFPQAIGLASTWDTEIMSNISKVISKETKSRGIRQVLSPTVDIARDVRWGRVAETYGEDPYLTSCMAVAFCKSFEEDGVVTTPKHFVANSGDGGRDSHEVWYSERHLREIYFPPYKACIKEAGTRSIMASYTSINGVPSGINKWLLTDILRDEWGFMGFVVSDYGVMKKLWQTHMVAATGAEGAAKAIKAGLDRDLPRIIKNSGYNTLIDAVRQGLLTEEDIDQCVRRVLTVKFSIGLFEDPYGKPEYAEQITNCDAHRKLALKAAHESIVLLKNEKSTLPFSKDLKKILVLGPDADYPKLGDYSSYDIRVVTILEGLNNKASHNTEIQYISIGTSESVSFNTVPEKYLYHEENRGLILGLVVQYFNNRYLNGKPAYETIDSRVQHNWDNNPIITKNFNTQGPFSVRWTGKLVAPKSGSCSIGLKAHGGIRLIIDGQTLIDRWDDPINEQEICTFDLQERTNHDLVIEYASFGSNAYLSFGWDITPKSDEELEEAAKAAKDADAVVVVAGITEGESKDRANLNLHPYMEKLINTVAATKTPTIVLLMAGSAVTMYNWIDNVQAVVEAWYPGEEGGNAVADVLYGNYNPGGKLPITFPKTSAQLPLYYNYTPSGRTYGYVDISQEPLFPFGHGLSYTKFEYKNLRFSSETIKPDETLKVYVDIKNIGDRKGDEVVQLYIRDVVASFTTPLKSLKDFKRITLEKGETKTVELKLTPDKLSILNENLHPVVEPGKFKVMIGSSSQDIRLEGKFEVIE